MQKKSRLLSFLAKNSLYLQQNLETNNMKAFKCFGVFLMASTFAACSSDDKSFVDQEPIAALINSNNDVKGISVTMADFTSADAGTRTTYFAVNGGVRVTWTQGDTIGIFPNEGGQIEFPIKTGSASHQAKFDGNGWALRSNSTYSAYYPYYKENVYRNNKTILLDYTGQTQVDNGSTMHLAKYDYQATGNVKTDDSGFLNFNFEHLGALMQFRLTVPRAGVYTSLALTSSEKVFVSKAELDISGNEPVLKPIEMSTIITLNLNNIELKNDNSELTVYMMLAPNDLSQGTLELKLYGFNNYTTSLIGHKIEAGKHYTINQSFDIPSDDEIINFVDSSVKSICVQYFDINGDGELSMAEAAAVIAIPTRMGDNGTPYYPVFANYTYYGGYDSETQIITHFNELQYFTSLKEIPAHMFDGQEELVKVAFPKTITAIGNEAFAHCKSLSSIEIPNGVTTIRERAFLDCERLTKVVIPNSVTSIETNAFAWCTSLTNIAIPNSITSLSSGFNNCTSLSTIEIPNSVISISGFSDCSNLTTIRIPNSVKTIGYGAFSGCSNLANIDIPTSVSVIDGYAFRNCISLTKIIIPQGVTSIENETFLGCSNLTSITIPNGVTIIKDHAFSDCTSLTNIEIPNSVTEIWGYAFNGCSNLTKVEIPNSVLFIGGYAFGNCTSLESITIPQSVDRIDSNIFEECINLKCITILRDYPPLGYLSIPKTCTIYVPAGSVERYKTNNQWSFYADQIQAIPE